MSRSFVSTFLFVLAALASAQDGVSTASAARTRSMSARGLIPPAREVAVEEFVNYHRHEIGRPKAGEAVGMDLRWSTDSATRETVLQVGLSTALTSDRVARKPLNLALVIDKSGSMAEADKLSRVKQALLALVGSLRPDDVVSLVAFDSSAQVCQPAKAVGNGQALREAIQTLQPGSATNIDAGLRLGYQEALKRYRKGATNRVVLLTDGIANQGVTEPAKIAQASLGFNDRGIDLSTIGVGSDLNEELLRTLAKSGRGLYHFVADDGDVSKVFVKEVQSLLSPVATEPNLHIAFGPGLRLEGVYGYAPKIQGNMVDVSLDNMNSGMTEVVLLRFKPSGEGSREAKASLSYQDLSRGKAIARTETEPFAAGEDASVAKNLAIARLAQAIRDMASSYEKGQVSGAQGTLDAAIAQTRQRYPNVEDEDVRRVLTTAERYQALLRRETGRDGSNLLSNGDLALGNVGFSSDLTYVDPRPNALWEKGYTVAPRWNAPLLHRLFAPGEYAAPKKPKGDEQVLYANVGGGEVVLWAASTPVKPHTRYRIRFQSLSLNAGREWVPDFSIAVNGTRSASQPAGMGRYGEIVFDWESGDAIEVKVKIVNLARDHDTGLVAIGNIEMVVMP